MISEAMDMITSNPVARSVLSIAAGGLTTLAFSPFDQAWLVLLTLAIAFYIWDKLTARQAAINAWWFSIGLQCSGVSWIFYSLHVHGSAPVFFAVVLIFLLCTYLSIYTALLAYTVNRFLPASSTMRLMVFYPAAWVLFEWLQGYVMTGFAWMQIGYTQIDMPLSGLAPVLGNHAVSGIVALSAGALVMAIRYLRQQELRSGAVVILPVVVVWVAAAFLRDIAWTEESGEPITVSLIQANIAQKDKWKPGMKQPTKDVYRVLTLSQQDTDLVVWPETAIPDYLHRAGPYLQKIAAELHERDTDLVLGIFSRDDGLLNSVVSTDGGIYHKRHLVPLGEYIPFRSLIKFFNRYVKIPMSDIASGADEQPLLTAAGARIGVSICFEEAFARDVLKDLPEAELLLNVSNDAWFEDSIEPHQHHAIARMRALETGRYMIRSTNTGITSLIGPKGEVLDRLPQFERAVLKGEVQPMTGSTPFVIWGDAMAVISCCLLLLGFGAAHRTRAG